MRSEPPRGSPCCQRSRSRAPSAFSAEASDEQAKNLWQSCQGEPYRKAGARLTEDAEDVQKRTKLGDASQQLREYDIYHRFDKAHVVMLAEEGFHSGKDAKTILEALRRMEAAGITETRAETEAGEHSGEAWLITEIGEEIGGRIHAGRSSGDFIPHSPSKSLISLS